MTKKIVIVGGGTAGASAAFSARKTDRTAEITVLDREPYPTYSRCGLPFAIHGIIQPLEKLIVFPETFFRNQKINHLINVVVREIQPEARVVMTEKGEQYSYDALVLATGAVPIKPPIKGVDAPSVLKLRTMDDARQIMQTAAAGQAVVVIGSSFIGLETAEALKAKGCIVTVVEALRTLWRITDAEISQLINQHLTAEGTKILEGMMVEEITPDSVLVRNPDTRVSGEKSSLPAQLVVLSAGVKPEVTLGRASGLTFGPTGGLTTNSYLQTSKSGIYTAGDCAEAISAITGEPVLSGLGTIAARQGVVAGANAAGGHLSAPPIINASVLKTHRIEIGSAGLTEEFLKDKPHPKFTCVSILVKYPSLPAYYPGGTEIYTKLIADAATGQILGGQIMGQVPVAARVNTLSVAIEKKMTVAELARADFCYSPPCADIWDPWAIAAQSLLRRLSG